MPREWRVSSPDVRRGQRDKAAQRLLAGEYGEIAQHLVELGLYDPSAHSLGRLADIMCALCCLNEHGSVRAGKLVECTGPIHSTAVRLLGALNLDGQLQEPQRIRVTGEPHPYEVVPNSELDKARRDFSVEDLCFQRHSGGTDSTVQ